MYRSSPIQKTLVLVGFVLLASSVTNGQLTSAMTTNLYNTWRSVYNKGVLNTGSTNIFNQRAGFIYDNNIARNSGGGNTYLKGTNFYTDQDYGTFANNHLGSNSTGFQQVASNRHHDDDGGLHGGKLAGVIIGSVVGGFLILAGIISGIAAWRHHVHKKRSTQYADYRSNTRVDRRDPYIDNNAPQEYYRESHRNTLNNNYSNETQASERFRENSSTNYRTYDRDVLVPRRDGENVSFHN